MNTADSKFAQKLSDAPDGHGTKTGRQTAWKERQEYEADMSTKVRETEQLQADLEAAKNKLACFASEAQRSKELENAVRNELHAAQVALKESEIKINELHGTLTTIDQEKELTSATAGELRLENECLKRTMAGARSPSKGGTSQEISDTLVDEVKEPRTQLAAMALERWVVGLISCGELLEFHEDLVDFVVSEQSSLGSTVHTKRKWQHPPLSRAVQGVSYR